MRVMSVASAVALVVGCGREETGGHRGEPAVHLRIGVDTVPPVGAELPRLVAAGDSLFHGQTGDAHCSDCHSDLAGSRWLADARFSDVVDFLVHGTKIRSKEVPNRPHGGTRLPPEQVRAIAVYLKASSEQARQDR